MMEVEYDDSRVTLGDGTVVVEGVKVRGSRSFCRDPRLSHLAQALADLPPLWKAPRQLAQVAPGMKWCASCAEVRPDSYFDVLENGKRDTWCKACRNDHTPWLRPTKYCSGCKQEKARQDFGIDLRNVDQLQSHCKACEAKRSAQRYRDRVGREVRSYTYRT